MTSGFFRHIEICTRHDPTAFVPFRIDGISLGAVTHTVASMLDKCQGDFVRNPDGGIAMHPQHANFASRTACLNRATDLLCAHYGKGKRDELYAVSQNWGDEPLAALDRVAVPWFGTRGFGVHVNAFVRKSDGLYIWIAERAADRIIDPGKLDHLVAGGSPMGISIEKNLEKESHEEAGIPAELARTAKPCGTISYKIDLLSGLRNDTLFIYDLELPETFAPQNTDGEVARFMLLPLNQVAEIVRDTDSFKFNCNVVIIDFLLRHGFLNATDCNYEKLSDSIDTLRKAPTPPLSAL